MPNLKTLGAAVVLLFAFGLTALADCPAPGIMDTPPCTAAQAIPNDSAAPGQTETPPVAETQSVELPSLAKVALDILTLF
ncbi:MAG TPA: hypothetical protein VE863_07610 [Pyrinomonadaceae bacterium]|jgi:hypothetical protein|nr:hypothetical protein [Pyrinomonadaceae bacterium]